MIPISVRQAYAAQAGRAEILVADLDQLFSAKDRNWFYTRRIKSLESFAQKVESGDYRDYSALEDFVGAMLVVPRLPDVKTASDFIETFFIPLERRPESPLTTSKRAYDFSFDDLRLYGHLRASEDLPPRPIDDIKFEIQVKTFLQHAWSISTHDLVYKNDSVSWARSRVAYQIKALLEHADLSVSSITSLETSEHIQLEGRPEAQIQAVIDLVKAEWPDEVLPTNRRRLANNLRALTTALQLKNAAELVDLLQTGKAAAGGEHLPGLSPYQCVVEYASMQRPAILRRALTKSSRFSIFVSTEALTRIGLTLQTAPNALAG